MATSSISSWVVLLTNARSATARLPRCSSCRWGSRTSSSSAGEAYFHRATVLQDAVERVLLPESGHFEMIVPESTSWPLVLEAFATAFERIAH